MYFFTGTRTTLVIITIVVVVALQFNEAHTFSLSPSTMMLPGTRRSCRGDATCLKASKENHEEIKPDILKPFLPAADPNYMNNGPVGESSFVLSRVGGPTKEELMNENILKIVTIECSDLEVNTLCWKCLGYRFNEETQSWTNTECFPNWRGKYPTPPDMIGMQRIYSPEIDKPSLKANQAIVRSVPVEHKQSLKIHLRPYGFTGYKYAELTPNKTRRAQCANWLLYYREELFGYSVEELRERRRVKKEEEEREANEAAPKDWQPPVKEVF